MFRIAAFNPRIRESRAEAKVAVLCDFAETKEPPLKVTKQNGRRLGGSAPILAIPFRSSHPVICVFVTVQEELAEGAGGGGVAVHASDSTVGYAPETSLSEIHLRFIRVAS